MLRTIERFVVVGELGRGSMGVVVRAIDPRLDREVAIKMIELTGAPPAVLSPNATIDLRVRPSIQDDALGEARMMARLSHPNVLPIYEVGLAADQVFLVMEYIEGDDLRTWLERPHSRAEIVDVLAQAARGLAAAHARGIVHRDFKPDNVLVGRDGRARVADFGLANLVASAMVSEDDARGTPRYMAAELAAGGPATPASDVFALCRTIAEVFGGDEDPRAMRDVPGSLRALLLAGLDDDPIRRPSIEALIGELREPATLARRRRRWPWAVAAVACGALVALAVTANGTGTACDDDHVLDGLWDRTTRGALSQLVSHAPGDAPAQLAASIDDRTNAIAALRREACQARERGELGAQQAASRVSCLERRAIELGVDLRRMLAHPEQFDAIKTDDLLYQAAQPASCGDLAAPAIRIARARVVELWQRLLDPAPADPAHQVPALSALERDARTSGEAELAVRAELALGQLYREQDKLVEADRIYERAYGDAVALESAEYQALVLCRRSALATLLSNPVAAESYAKLALALVDRPALHPITRVRVYAMLATSAWSRGQPARALPFIRTARELIASAGHAMDDVESQLRLTQAAVALDADGATPATIRQLRDDVDWAKARFGERGDYPFMLYNLATALGDAGDIAAALPYGQRAVELFTQRYGPRAPTTLRARLKHGWNLVELRRLEDGERELTAVLADCEGNESTRGIRPQLLRTLGQAVFRLGRFDAGLRLTERAIDEFTSQLGTDHARTLYARGDLISRLLELGRLDETEHQLAAVEEAAGRTKVPIASYLVGVQRPQLLRWRGQLKHAEQLAREALAAAEETKLPELQRADMLWSLGTILADEERWSDARGPLEQNLALLARLHAAPDDLADTQVPLADALLHLGERRRAAELAHAAAAALERFPSHVRARTQLAALLPRLP